ncbi:MAG: hypothetical protein M1825_006341 [Sarcosagium campestre]|nr:MAG: hypothetical protein M1825_006341 [Sarcosagium campestre]
MRLGHWSPALVLLPPPWIDPSQIHLNLLRRSPNLSLQMLIPTPSPSPSLSAAAVSSPTSIAPPLPSPPSSSASPRHSSTSVLPPADLTWRLVAASRTRNDSLPLVKSLYADAIAQGIPVPIQRMADLAARLGHAPTLTFCLQRGADATNPRLIQEAVSSRSLESVDALIDAGASPDANLLFVGSPLILAVIGRNLPMVKQLLARGAHVQLKNPRVYGGGQLQLLAAAVRFSHDETDILQTLLRQPHIKIAGSGALQAAAQKGYVQVTELLLDAGAPVDEVLRNPVTLRYSARSAPSLHLAADGDSESHFEVVRLLLRAGADPFRQDRGGLTALERAKRPDIISILTAGQRQEESKINPATRYTGGGGATS